MKSILGVIVLLLLSFLIGSNKPVDTACSLPDTSEWSVVNSDICLKVNGDSLFWTMKSDKADILAITASAGYKLLSSGKISLTYNLPLLSQDLSYIYGEKNEILHQHIIHASLCKQEDDRLVFYSSAGDSIVFCRNN